MNVIRIYPRFGIRNLLPSDTLWGNLLFAIKRLYGGKYFDDILKKFLDGKPPFLISSSFPFEFSDGSFSYYFPIPFLGMVKDELGDENKFISTPNDMIKFKKFKKIKFVEKTTFEKIISSEVSFEDLFIEFRKQKSPNDNSGLKFIELPSKTYTLHNTIDRWYTKTVESQEGGALFWEEEYIFASQNIGLFFLVEGDVELLKPALRFLADIGIGGNNTIGKGKFSFEIENFEFQKLSKESNSKILLSLYSPNQNDIKTIKELGSNLWYELKIRRGFSGVDFDITPQQKNAVTVFGEGSVFATKENLIGRLIKTGEINSDYIIYNYYYGFFIPSFFKVIK